MISSIFPLSFIALGLLLQTHTNAQTFNRGRAEGFLKGLEGNFFYSPSALLSTGEFRSSALAARQAARNRRNVEKAVAVAASRAATCRPAVCFILDGSNQVNGRNWEAQTSFVQLVAAIIGGLDGTLYTAVEFTNQFSGRLLSPLNTFNQFSLDLAVSTPSGLSAPNLSGAMKYCTNTLSSNVGGTAFQKIVTFADLDTTVTGKQEALNIARNWDGDDFSNPNPFNDMCGGVIGIGSKRFWVDLAGGRSTDVRRLPSWTLLIDLIVDLVEDICGPVPGI